MERRYAARLLVAARLELAHRGVFPWAAELRLFELQVGLLPVPELGRPPAEALEATLGQLSREQRRALRRLLMALGVRASDRASGHGEETEVQGLGCQCGACRSVGVWGEQARPATGSAGALL